MNRAVLGSVALAVGLSLAAAPPAAADDEGLSFRLDRAAPTETAQNTPIDARVGNLTSRPSGLPGTGARRLTSAKVRQDLVADRVSGTFVLDAAPTESTRSHLRVSFGHLDGNNCQADIEKNSDTLTTTAGFSRSGRTITMNVAESQAGYEDWDCAFAALTDNLQVPPTTTYSVLIGALRNVYAQPELRVQAPQLLRSKKLKLVRGVWTTLEVDVKNVGRADAGKVLLTGRGKGLKVKQARGRYALSAGSTDTVRLRVKLVKKLRRTKLKLVGRASGVTARRSSAVRRVNPPARPKPGRYASRNNVKFRITTGRTPKVSGFRVYAQTTCGGYPDFPIITMNHYDFPTTKIGRNGIVDRVVYRDLYTVRLQLLVRGGKVTRGYFRYGGPNRCRSVKTFTAKRVGR
jgi:hypothetical protein